MLTSRSQTLKSSSRPKQKRTLRPVALVLDRQDIDICLMTTPSRLCRLVCASSGLVLYQQMLEHRSSHLAVLLVAHGLQHQTFQQVHMVRLQCASSSLLDAITNHLWLCTGKSTRVKKHTEELQDVRAALATPCTTAASIRPRITERLSSWQKDGRCEKPMSLPK